MDTAVAQTSDGYLLRGRLEQTQADAPFPLQVSLVVHLEGGDRTEHRVALGERKADFELALSAAPIRVDADPRFDLFRSLVPGESPPALSALFGAEVGLILLPANAPAELAEGYRALAQGWRQGSPGWEIALDQDVKRLPDDRPVWLLGWSNRFVGNLAADETRFSLDEARQLLRLPEGDYPGRDFSLALFGRARRSADRLGRRLAPRSPARSGPQASSLRQVQLPGVRWPGTEQPSQGSVAGAGFRSHGLVERSASAAEPTAARPADRGPRRSARTKSAACSHSLSADAESGILGIRRCRGGPRYRDR